MPMAGCWTELGRAKALPLWPHQVQSAFLLVQLVIMPRLDGENNRMEGVRKGPVFVNV